METLEINRKSWLKHPQYLLDTAALIQSLKLCSTGKMGSGVLPKATHGCRRSLSHTQVGQGKDFKTSAPSDNQVDMSNYSMISTLKVSDAGGLQ